MTTPAVNEGGCLCGKVRYTVPAQPVGVVACHCRACQKQAGTAFSVIAIYPQVQFQLDGECATYETMGASGHPVRRHFCSNCGSPIYSQTKTGKDAGLAFVKAGTLDDVSELSPTAHFWTSSKQPWVAVPEGVAAIETE